MKLHKMIKQTLIIILNLLPSVFGKEINIEFSDQLPPCPAEYLTDCLLASDGTVWVTSEGNGIYCLEPSQKLRKNKESWFDVSSYYQEVPKNINYCAIAEDKQKRIWIGTDNKGVIVFNGEKWKNYDRENALLGEHVYDITVSSLTGDVAIATSGGVNIFNPQTGQWTNLTRAEGLVEDQVETLAYDGKGSLWLGYACGGISQLEEKGNYRIIKTDQAKWYWDRNNRVRQPMDGTGNGLPSNLCNAVLSTKSGSILLGTNSGLAFKKSKGEWKYIRGEDFHDKNKGLWDVKVDRNISLKAASLLLPEDYITCLAETHEGCWIGFRQKGAVLINPQTLKILKVGKFPENVKTPFVKSLLTLPGGSVYAVTYGHGIIKIYEGGRRNQLRMVQNIQFPQHPSFPHKKTLEEIEKEVEILEKNIVNSKKKLTTEPSVIAWKEDWATQGNWCGRYGLTHALLCATHFLSNDEIYCTPKTIKVTEYIGCHKRNDDLISFRPLGDDASDNINVLFNPKTGTRVATEWTDNGEEYNTTFDGPDIWIDINVPEGTHELALYFYNYNGKDASIGLLRDYQIEIRKSDSSNIDIDRFESDKSFSQLLSIPVLSRQRVKEFSGSGVYKTFLLNNPGHYYIRILNNYSSDSILNGIFVSRLDNYRKIYNDKRLPSTYAGIIPKAIGINDKESPEFKKLEKLWNRTSLFMPFYPYLSYENKLKLSLIRFMRSNSNCKNLYNNYLWEMNIMDKKKQEEFEKIMMDSWHKNQHQYILCRSQEFYPFSPGVIPFSSKECEIMEYMNIDWTQYLPSNPNKPEIEIAELKEKISALNSDDISKLKNVYREKKMEEYKKKMYN